MWDQHEPETAISSFVFGLLERQKPLHEPNEFLSTFVQPYVFRLKEKNVVTEGEQESVVATKKPSVATEAQPGASSSTVVQSFFRAEQRATKDKQAQ